MKILIRKISILFTVMSLFFLSSQGVNTAQAVGSPQLYVSLSSSNQPAQVVPKDIEDFEVLVFNVRADNCDLVLKDLVFKMYGLYHQESFDDIKLLQGNTVLDFADLNNDGELRFYNLNLMLQEDQELELTLKFDIDDDAIAGDYFSIELNSANNIEIEDLSSGDDLTTGDIHGDFPIRGNIYVISSVSYDVSYDEVYGDDTNNSQNDDNLLDDEVLKIEVSSPFNQNVDYNFEKFNALDIYFTNESQNSDIAIEEIKLRINGSIDYEEEVDEINLYHGSVLLETGFLNNGYAYFDNLNFEIEAGKKEIFDIKVDFDGEVDSNIYLSIPNSSYIDAESLDTGDAVEIDANFPLESRIYTLFIDKSNFVDEDVCLSDKILKEYYFDGSEYTYKLVTCSGYCENGLCVDENTNISIVDEDDYEQEVQEEEELSNPYADINSSVAETLRGRAAIYLSHKNIIKGYLNRETLEVKFKGYRTLNRAEVCKFIVLSAYGSVEDINTSPFPDVSADAWYAKYVQKAKEKGLVHGYADGKFRPAQTVTTAEFLKMLTEAHNLQQNLSVSYYDVSLADWYYQYAGVAQKYDLFPEKGNYLEPNKVLTRWETAVAIYQLIK